MGTSESNNNEKSSNKKKIFTVIGVLVFAIVIVCMIVMSDSDKPEPKKFEKPESKLEFFKDADFKAECIGGGTFSSDDVYSHKLTVLNIWATYCGPCIEEMPILNKISIERKDDVNIVGTLIDISKADGSKDDSLVAIAEEIMGITGATYPQIIPTKEMYKVLYENIQVTPTTLFIDSEGNVLGTVTGSQSEESWNQLIDLYLKK